MALREPIAALFETLTRRLAEVLELGVARGEFKPGIDVVDTAATIAAVLQGGYVLARAANATEPFTRAINGGLALLRLQLKDGVGPTTG